MGQKSTKTLPQLTDFNPHDWINDNFVSNNDAGINQFGKMHTLKNRNTEQLIDKYQQMFISQKDYQDYLHSYQWRRQQSYIVNAAYMQTKNKNKYCSTTYQVDIYIEHPKNRLSDFSDIPFPDTLYVLKAMLIGYGKLFKHVGSFPIREEQVCINDRGFVKVWFNKDLSKNYPEEWEIQPVGQVDQEQEQDMVNQIITTITKNSDQQLQPNPTFQQFYQRNQKINKIGFDQALQLVDQYADQQNVQIPQNFKSVVQVYEHQQGLYQIQGDLSNNMSQHQQNNDFIGQLTQGQINLRNQSYVGSRVQKITNQSMKSKQSHRSSQIDNLQKYSSKIVNNQTQFGKMNQSGISNRNKAQLYRLSGISRLDDKVQMPPTYQPSTQYQPSSQYQPMTTYQPASNFNRQSQMSNVGNYSQVSYNVMTKQTDSPVWMSLKPQQPYIPSSSAYLNLQNNQNFNQNLNQSNGLIQNINNLNTIRVQNNGYLNSSRQNHSIQQKAQQSNISGGHHTQQFANLKFEKQLQQQIKRDQQQIQIRQRNNKQKPKKSIDNTFAEPQIILNRTHSQNSGLSTDKNKNNQLKTAQFINNGMEYYLQPQQNSSNFAFNSINFSNGYQKPGTQGATIFIPPPQRITSFNRFQANVRGFSIPGQPIRMIKNSSQPFIPTVPYSPPQYTRIMSPPTQIQINPQFIQPISPKSLPPQSPPQSPQSNYFIYQNQNLFTPKLSNTNDRQQNYNNSIKLNNTIKQLKQQDRSASSVRYSKNNTQIQSAYCTVKDQIPLDPQILNDMLIYI